MSESPHEHRPVLLKAVVELLSPRPGATLLDGTIGLAGHAAALLPRLMPGGRCIGLDVDAQMLAEARVRLDALAMGGFELQHASYADFPAVLAALGLPAVDHMLLDLGVNSAQLADPARGFSFDRDGPLDMRFDRAAQGQTALDLVNALPERELADVFYRFAQEGNSRKIAKRICQVRHEGRITTTRALARAVETAQAVRGQERGGGRLHPATRVFQALRIAVNDELGNLERFLKAVPDHWTPGGTLVVISFHSLEDGLVKRTFRSWAADGIAAELTERPLVADAEERHANPRSRSAKLRAARRLN